jgi:hypothetical protein
MDRVHGDPLAPHAAEADRPLGEGGFPAMKTTLVARLPRPARREPSGPCRRTVAPSVGGEQFLTRGRGRW